MRSSRRAQAPFRAVSLFSNCGAGDVGYANAGVDFEVMAELMERRLDVALINHPSAVGVVGDLRATWTDVVRAYRRKSRARPALLAACPPCQGLSTARGGRGHELDADAGSKDRRNLLVGVIAAVATELRPRVVVVENVEAFLSRLVRHPKTRKPVSAARLLVNLLRKDYVAYPMIENLQHYGVPQSRRRAFLTFIHRTEHGNRELEQFSQVPFPCQTHGPNSVSGAPPLAIGEVLADAQLSSLDAASVETAKDATDPLHSVPIWLDRRYEMVRAIPPNSGKSAWDNLVCPECEYKADKPDAVCRKCGTHLLRPIVVKDGNARLVRGFDTSYRRISPEAPAPTITTASGHLGSDHTIHPSETRLLSIRECQILQAFPTSFDWGNALEEWGSTPVRAMIGEAVPPLFTEMHGRSIMRVLTGTPRVALMSGYAKAVTDAIRRLHRKPTHRIRSEHYTERTSGRRAVDVDT